MEGRTRSQIRAMLSGMLEHLQYVIWKSCLPKLKPPQMLHRTQMIDSIALRRYLLEKVQHIVGGFGKGVGEPPGQLSCR